MDFFIFIVFIVLAYSMKVTEEKKAHSGKTSHRADEPDLQVMNVRNAAIQILESTYLMANSNNIDTITSRAEFIKERIDVVVAASKNGHYHLELYQGAEQYKNQYGIEEIKSWQDEILSNPSEFNFDVFYAKCLLLGFERHYENQLDDISKLKMDYAIENRFEKLEEKITKVESILDELEHSEGVNEVIEKTKSDFEDIKSKIDSRELSEYEKLNRIDGLISRLKSEANEHKNEKDFGFYRICEYKIGQNYFKKGKERKGITQLLKCAYIDLNGAKNTSGYSSISGSDITYFSPDNHGNVAPAIVGDLSSVISDKEMSVEELQNIFLKEAKKIHKELDTPVAPTEAWNELHKLIT